MSARHWLVTSVVAMTVASQGSAQQMYTRQWTLVDSARIAPWAAAALDSHRICYVTSTGWGVGSEQIRATSDGGITWRVVRADTVPFHGHKYWGISYPATGHFVALEETELYGWYINATTDDGLTWHEFRTTGLPHKLMGLRMFDSSRGIVLRLRDAAPDHVDSVLRTTDGGVSWTGTPIRLIEGEAQEFLAFGPDDFAIRTKHGSGWQSLYRTRDGGITWEELNSLPQKTTTTCFLDGDIGFAGDYYGAIVVTRDGGRTWFRETRSTQLGPITHISFCDTLNGVIAGLDGDWVVRTTDGGLTWSTELLPFTAGAPTSVLLVNQDRALLTTHASVFRSDTARVLTRPGIIAPAKASYVAAGNVRFTWNRLPWCSEYEFQIDTMKGFSSPALQATTSQDTSVTIRLDSGLMYWARVRGRVGDAYTPWSIDTYAISTRSAPPPPQVLDTPVFIRPVLPLQGRLPRDIVFEWSRVDSAIGYQFLVRDMNGFTRVVDTVTTETTWELRNLRPNGDYSAAVRAYSASVWSAWSQFFFRVEQTTWAQPELDLGACEPTFKMPIRCGDELLVRFGGCGNRTARIDMIDILGTLVKSEVRGAGEDVRVTLPPTSGVYLLRIAVGSAGYTHTIVLRE